MRINMRILRVQMNVSVLRLWSMESHGAHDGSRPDSSDNRNKEVRDDLEEEEQQKSTRRKSRAISASDVMITCQYEFRKVNHSFPIIKRPIYTAMSSANDKWSEKSDKGLDPVPERGHSICRIVILFLFYTIIVKTRYPAR